MRWWSLLPFGNQEWQSKIAYLLIMCPLEHQCIEDVQLQLLITGGYCDITIIIITNIIITIHYFCIYIYIYSNPQNKCQFQCVYGTSMVPVGCSLALILWYPVYPFERVALANPIKLPPKKRKNMFEMPVSSFNMYIYMQYIYIYILIYIYKYPNILLYIV